MLVYGKLGECTFCKVVAISYNQWFWCLAIMTTKEFGQSIDFSADPWRMKSKYKNIKKVCVFLIHIVM